MKHKGYFSMFTKWYFWLAVVCYLITVIWGGTETFSVQGVIRSFVVITFLFSLIAFLGWVIFWIGSVNKTT